MALAESAHHGYLECSSAIRCAAQLLGWTIRTVTRPSWRASPSKTASRVPNRFELVLTAAQRARNISRGEELTLDRDNDKNPVVALREIAEQTIDLGSVESRPDQVAAARPRAGAGGGGGARPHRHRREHLRRHGCVNRGSCRPKAPASKTSRPTISRLRSPPNWAAAGAAEAPHLTARDTGPPFAPVPRDPKARPPPPWPTSPCCRPAMPGQPARPARRGL